MFIMIVLNKIVIEFSKSIIQDRFILLNELKQILDFFQ